jgi:hypothetical protein
MFCARKQYLDTLGVDAVESENAHMDGDQVHFLVSRNKSPNYLEHCQDPLSQADDPVGIINQYTEHSSNWYAQVNLALASDSSSLAEYGAYIKQLHKSILSFPVLQTGHLLYRGVDLSAVELTKMEELRAFYIPSFTSTSIESNKAYSKNTQLIIKKNFASPYACSMTPELSPYCSTEAEVLLACYCAFRLERVERVGSVNYVTLYLDDHLTCMDRI